MTHKMLISLIVWFSFWAIVFGGVFLALEIPAAMGKAPWYTCSTTATYIIRKTGPIGAAVFVAILGAGMAMLSQHFVNPESFDKRKVKKVHKARAKLAKAEAAIMEAPNASTQ